MYIDTHCHYEDEAFSADRREVLLNIIKSDCIKVVDCAIDVESSKKILSLAEEYDFLYAAVGIHPEEALKYSPEAMEEIRRLAAHKKVVAIGETGLDYHWDFAPKDVQQENFRANIRLSKELGLPLVVHDREAHQDTLDIMYEENVPEEKAVLHCFSGSLEMAREVAKHGWYFSFGGAVTFKNAKKFVDIINFIPEDKLMLETDAPYMTPEPFRGTRNDSTKIPYTIAKIAEIKGVSAEKIEKITTDNAIRFFGLNN